MDKFQFGSFPHSTEPQPLKQLANRLRSTGFRVREPADESEEGQTLREGAKEIYLHYDFSGQPLFLYFEYVTEYIEKFYGLDDDAEFEERSITPLGRSKFMIGADGVFTYQPAVDPEKPLKLLFGEDMPQPRTATSIRSGRLQRYYSEADRVPRLKLDPSNVEPGDVPAAISNPSSTEESDLANEIQHALALAERLTISTAHYRTRDLSESRAVEKFVELSEFVEFSVAYEGSRSLKLSPTWIGFHLPDSLEKEQKAEAIWKEVQPVWQDMTP